MNNGNMRMLANQSVTPNGMIHPTQANAMFASNNGPGSGVYSNSNLGYANANMQANMFSNGAPGPSQLSHMGFGSGMNQMPAGGSGNNGLGGSGNSPRRDSMDGRSAGMGMFPNIMSDNNIGVPFPRGMSMAPNSAPGKPNMGNNMPGMYGMSSPSPMGMGNQNMTPPSPQQSLDANALNGFPANMAHNYMNGMRMMNAAGQGGDKFMARNVSINPNAFAASLGNFNNAQAAMNMNNLGNGVPFNGNGMQQQVNNNMNYNNNAAGGGGGGGNSRAQRR